MSDEQCSSSKFQIPRSGHWGKGLVVVRVRGAGYGHGGGLFVQIEGRNRSTGVASALRRSKDPRLLSRAQRPPMPSSRRSTRGAGTFS